VRQATVLLLIAPLLSLWMAGCSTPGQGMTDEDAIRDWFDRYAANNNAGVFESFGDFWTEDVVWLPPDAPVMEGRQAILEYARPFFEGYTIDQRFDVKEVRTAGRLAFARADFVESYTPKAAQTAPLNLNVKAILLFQRQPDGEWAATHCVWNRNAPPAQ
jgi:uncharacterized protein (TIGR02246 family)